jgi:L-malate glycosyltransferase
MSQTVNQLVPSVVPGDATTSHTLQLKRLLEDLGYNSEVYALAVHPKLEDRVRLIGELAGPSRPDDFLIYQLSGHSELADWLIGRREQVALNYHNITPYSFFWPYDRSIALALLAAQLQVSQLAYVAGGAVCDSAFNASDLKGRGLENTSVAPILLDLGEFDAEPDPHTTEMLERSREKGGAHFLFVGGIAPHKAQHDLVRALAVYREVYDPNARLSLVGRPMSGGYFSALESFVAELGLCDAVNLCGGVTHEQLVAYYRHVDVFLSASDHEGFCVPLIEAMHHGLPVVAYAAGAVADTLGDGGVLVRDKSPGALAAAMWRVASDEDTRRRLSAAGGRRANCFSLEATRKSMTAFIRRWTASGT